MTLRSLPEIHTHMMNIAAAYTRIHLQYQWAVNFALTPTKADGQGSGQIAYSNPTLGVVSDEHKAEIRKLLEEFDDTVQRADTELTRIRKALDRRLGPEDPRKPRGTFPRSMTDLERVRYYLQNVQRLKEADIIDAHLKEDAARERAWVKRDAELVERLNSDDRVAARNEELSGLVAELTRLREENQRLKDQLDDLTDTDYPGSGTALKETND